MRVRRMMAGAAIGTMIGMTVSRTRRWWLTWGIEADEKTKALAGDDVVSVPVASETRGITIETTPDRIWPWLTQTGWHRAGWYTPNLDHDVVLGIGIYGQMIYIDLPRQVVVVVMSSWSEPDNDDWHADNEILCRTLALTLGGL